VPIPGYNEPLTTTFPMQHTYIYFNKIVSQVVRDKNIYRKKAFLSFGLADRFPVYHLLSIDTSIY